MKSFLKIKIKSLAAESRIIRREERKSPGRKSATEDFNMRERLHHHRVYDVRRESRAANLAYGFLRNRPYRTLERTCRTKPPWDKVERLVLRYSGVGISRTRTQEIKQRLAEWMAAEAPDPEIKTSAEPLAAIRTQ